MTGRGVERWATPPFSSSRSSSLAVGAATTCILLLCCGVTPAYGAGSYDPCAAQPSVGKNDGFTIGIAFYPGGAAEDWASLHPCLYADRVNLTASGVASMVFRPAVDKMSFFRGSPVDETALFESAAGAQLMTMVAYAGNGTAVVRSEPRLVRSSSSTAIIGGTTVGRVNTLTLVARFDRGTLQYLQWHNMGCGSCAEGDACMSVGDGHSACAGTEEACTCEGDNCLLDLTAGDSLRCHLTVAAAFSGTDKFSAPLTSGAQVERLGKYSASQAASGAGTSALANAIALKDKASSVATGK